MTGFVIVIHALVCILLAVVVLAQSGRGGGLTEAFASAETMFGARTNEFMVKSTTILGVIFLATCLGLAFLSARKDKSLMTQDAVTKAMQKTAPVAGDTTAQPASVPAAETK